MSQSSVTPAWAMTCRQMYSEISAERHRTIVHSFASSRAFCQSMKLRQYVIGSIIALPERLYQVHLNAGPAKFGTNDQSSATHDALNLLRKEAPRLVELYLSFDYYISAAKDDIVMSDRLLRLILAFDNLKNFDLFMHDPPPGPVGGLKDPKDFEQTLKKLQVLRHVLARYTCSRVGAQDMNEWTLDTRRLRGRQIPRVKAEVRAILAGHR